MLLKKITILTTLFLVFNLSTQSQNSEKDIKKIAEKFVKSADIQDADKLTEVLHPTSQQFVVMGPRLVTSSAEQYIAAIKAKKLGGIPREITFKTVDFMGDSTAVVVLEAVSSKFKFLYQLSIAKSKGKWTIIGIMTEVKPAG